MDYVDAQAFFQKNFINLWQFHSDGEMAVMSAFDRR